MIGHRARPVINPRRRQRNGAQPPIEIHLTTPEPTLRKKIFDTAAVILGLIFAIVQIWLTITSKDLQTHIATLDTLIRKQDTVLFKLDTSLDVLKKLIVSNKESNERLQDILVINNTLSKTAEKERRILSSSVQPNFEFNSMGMILKEPMKVRKLGKDLWASEKLFIKKKLKPTDSVIFEKLPTDFFCRIKNVSNYNADSVWFTFDFFLQDFHDSVSFDNIRLNIRANKDNGMGFPLDCPWDSQLPHADFSHGGADAIYLRIKTRIIDPITKEKLESFQCFMFSYTDKIRYMIKPSETELTEIEGGIKNRKNLNSKGIF